MKPIHHALLLVAIFILLFGTSCANTDNVQESSSASSDSADKLTEVNRNNEQNKDNLAGQASRASESQKEISEKTVKTIIGKNEDNLRTSTNRYFDLLNGFKSRVLLGDDFSSRIKQISLHRPIDAPFDFMNEKTNSMESETSEVIVRILDKKNNQILIMAKDGEEYTLDDNGKEKIVLSVDSQGDGKITRVSYSEIEANAIENNVEKIDETIKVFQSQTENNKNSLSEIKLSKPLSEHDGYIIVLKEEPLVKIDIAEKRSKKEKNILADSQVLAAKQQKKAAIKNEQDEIITTLTTSNKDIKVEKRFDKSINAISVKNLKEEDITELKKNPKVKSVWPNIIVHATLTESVGMINADDLWQLYDQNNIPIKGTGIRVAVIDTGIDYTHPDLGACTTEQFLSGNCAKVVGGYDFINNDPDPIDDHGHGTHCAATVAGVNELYGLNGVAPEATLYAYKVLSAEGYGTMEAVMFGIERAMDPNNDGNFSDHVDVISMSLGGEGSPDDPQSLLIDEATSLGIVSVIAAGNSREFQTIGSPGTARTAITVAAGCKSTTGGYCQGFYPLAYFSSKGPVISTSEILSKPDVVAPGVDICAAQHADVWNDRQCHDDLHIALAGTSMATPHVAGVAALLKQAHPEWNAEQVKSAIMLSADPLSYTQANNGFDQIVEGITQGAGMVDALEAYNQPFLTDKNYFSYNFQLTEYQVTLPLSITNIGNTPITLNFEQGELINTAQIMTTYYSDILQQHLIEPINFELVSIPSVTIQPQESQTVNVNVNFPAEFSGIYSGAINIIQTNGEISRIPFMFSRMVYIHLFIEDANIVSNKPIRSWYSIVNEELTESYRPSDNAWSYGLAEANFIVPAGQNYYGIATPYGGSSKPGYFLVSRLIQPVADNTEAGLKFADAKKFVLKSTTNTGDELTINRQTELTYLYYDGEEPIYYGMYSSITFEDDFDYYITRKEFYPFHIDSIFRHPAMDR